MFFLFYLCISLKPFSQTIIHNISTSLYFFVYTQTVTRRFNKFYLILHFTYFFSFFAINNKHLSSFFNFYSPSDSITTILKVPCKGQQGVKYLMLLAPSFIFLISFWLLNSFLREQWGEIFR